MPAVAETQAVANAELHSINWELGVRVPLVAAAVGVCYLFSWDWLRILTASLNHATSAGLGVSSVRVSPDLVLFPGRLVRYALGCTMADAWCGAIPLVWKLRQSIGSNLTYLAGLAAFVFVLNTARLALSNFIIFRLNVPWTIGHQGAAALGYLALWLLIVRRHAWR